MAEETGENQGTQQGEQQGGYHAPETQEEFDRMVKARLDRATSKAEKATEAKYADAIAKAAEYDKLQEASKSDLEKAIARAEKAEREVGELKAAAERHALAAEVAKDKGIADSSLLEAYGTREAMEDAAVRIAALIPSASPKYPSTPNGGVPGGSEKNEKANTEEKLRKAAGLKLK